MVPLTDLGRRAAALEPELSAAVDRVVRSGQYLLGPELDAFEAEFAAYAGARHAVGVASGTDALRLALVALAVEPGDEVIVPAFTAVPTAAAVCAAGAVPVFVDVDPATAALDLEAAAAAVTPRTRAVIPVHLYGRPVPLPDLGMADLGMADLGMADLGVPVVEDAAQAHGALDPNVTRGLVAAYSFYPTKNLGGIGDGGAVVTDDDEVAARVRRLRVHGREPTGGGPEDASHYGHTDISTNSRLSELEAAALRIGLTRLDAGNQRRREIAARYRAAAPDLRWQADDPRHVYHLCVARIADRAEFRLRAPFTTALHYERTLTRQRAYERFVRDACPEADAWAAECVSFPCFPEMTDDEVDVVCRFLR